jgi:Protein of unknown function (DUF4058)
METKSFVQAEVAGGPGLAGVTNRSPYNRRRDPMPMPFPGMAPYLEHPALWPSVHTRMIVTMASLLRPNIRPRYVASVEERVFIEGPEHQRSPDVMVHRVPKARRGPKPAGGIATPLVVEAKDMEVHQPYIAIMDRHRDLEVVTVIELVSPTNKAAGPGRDSYLSKRQEFRDSDCHLVEIDLLRRGRPIMSVPKSLAEGAKPFDYMACVNRSHARHRFELYPIRLRDPLPTIGIPLAEPDSDAPLAIQTALELVYEDGDYILRMPYDKPCKPRLSPADQEWATECWSAYRRTHPDLFPDDNGG